MFPEHIIDSIHKGGWIEVICGSMFSGKTEEFIRRLRRAQLIQLKVKVFKSIIDNRYDVNEIVSHDKKKISGISVKDADQILSLGLKADVVGIDEVQFFEKNIVHVCNELANKGIRVIVSGLDMDFLGRPFGYMPQLLAISEYVTKMHAICVYTGSIANYTHRKIVKDAIVMVGGDEIYEPLSRVAFSKIIKKI